jgi:hypothetical protein
VRPEKIELATGTVNTPPTPVVTVTPGNVGIGTTTPTQALDVSGGVVISGGVGVGTAPTSAKLTINGTTSLQGATTVTTGGLTVSGGGATISGDTTISSNLASVSVHSAQNDITANGIVNLMNGIRLSSSLRNFINVYTKTINTGTNFPGGLLYITDLGTTINNTNIDIMDGIYFCTITATNIGYISSGFVYIFANQTETAAQDIKRQNLGSWEADISSSIRLKVGSMEDPTSRDYKVTIMYIQF